MRHRLTLGFCALLVAGAVPSATAEGAYSCPATPRPATPFVPPASFQPGTAPHAFWFGTNALWTSVNTVWQALPRREGGYSNNLFLWKEGYDPIREPSPEIVVILRRLDAAAPLAVSRERGTNAIWDGVPAMLTQVTIPAAGCWEITSYHAGNTLTYVVSVQTY